MAKRKKLTMPTLQELQEMAEHVLYEINEFRKAVHDLPSLRGHDPEWNRALESTLLHVRILRGFFFGEGGHDEDVFASHYCENWKPKKDDIFNGTREDLDKRLAHLTLARLKLKEKNWELDKMNAAVERLILDFKNALRVPQSEWFHGLETGIVVATIGSEGNRTDSGSTYQNLLNS